MFSLSQLFRFRWRIGPPQSSRNRFYAPTWRRRFRQKSRVAQYQYGEFKFSHVAAMCVRRRELMPYGR